MNESDRECRKEGGSAFQSNPFDIDKNPHSVLTDGRRRRQWQYGWEDAQTDAERDEYK